VGQYLPVVALTILAVVFAALSRVASQLLAPSATTAAKRAPYECGILPGREAPERFPVRFYLIAMIFVVFDIEIIFLFPWAVRFRELGLFGLVEMALFIGLVFVAYVYIWRTGGLDWAEEVDAPLDALAAADLRAGPDAVPPARDREVAGAR
jgi:NADH-quinone oxidoreductase subunit A